MGCLEFLELFTDSGFLLALIINTLLLVCLDYKLCDGSALCSCMVLSN